MSRPPDPIKHICAQRQALGSVFLDAVRDLNGLVVAQGRALVQGDTALDQFDAALMRARERRDNAKAAFLAHVQAHGC